MMQEVGQCSDPMVDLDDPAPRSSSCLDDDRALALVDGQLSLEAREQIEAHLDRCAACRRFVSELAKESLFESPTEQPTDLEKTGYAPGRPLLLDVAFTVRDLAATRVGVPDPEARAEVLAPPRAERARAAEPSRVPSPAPLKHAAPAERPRSDDRPRPAATSRTQPHGLDRRLVIVLVATLLVFVLSAFAALLSLGAFGYVFFHS
jgi:anti-sigma factor RsiW